MAIVAPARIPVLSAKKPIRLQVQVQRRFDRTESASRGLA
jgi:hypothetical protein